MFLAGAVAVLAGISLAGPNSPSGKPDAPSVSREPKPLDPTQAPAGAAAGDVNPEALPPGVPADAQRAIVAKNVDGDTIWVEITEPGGTLAAGAVHKVRILEINTPESTNRTECFGAQASEFAKRELPVGSTVFLAADKQDRDRFGRFLRYVWKSNGDFYNEKAVVLGFAKVVLYRPNDRFIERLRAAEARAREAAAGLWDVCVAP
ncbi:MAG: thermonuclease family protein [Actinomycetota bacterium]